jgi:glycerophosphoryl diester phosphodiesterase
MCKVWYAAALVLALASTAHAGATCDDAGATPAPYKNRPLVVGHRGAPGYFPDHTIEGYTFAIEQGVDFIEPDLVPTKDGVLIARHEPNIIGTTDVSKRPEFADRKKTVKVDGVEETGWFVSDFTLAEIKTLRAIQPLAERDHQYDGKFQIPTFDEVIALAQRKAKETGRVIGIYPETKHPTYHRALGLPIEETMLAQLDKAGWNHAGAPVFIQSFEVANLKELRTKTKIPLVQLIDGNEIDPKTGNLLPDTRPYDWTVAGKNATTLDMLTPAGLKEIATYADVVAPWKRYLVKAIAGKVDNDGKPVDVTGDGKVTDADFNVVANPQLFKDAHAAGLKVHTWTFRDEAYRLALDYNGDPANEYTQFFDLGLDGLFSDNCKSAVPARNKWVAAHP